MSIYRDVFHSIIDSYKRVQAVGHGIKVDTCIDKYSTIVITMVGFYVTPCLYNVNKPGIYFILWVILRQNLFKLYSSPNVLIIIVNTSQECY